jgi:hypothetical protein
VSRETPEVAAARRVAQEAESVLHRSPAFLSLEAGQRAALLHDLGTIRRGLAEQQSADAPASKDPYALALETPFERVRRGPQPAPDAASADGQPSASPAAPADGSQGAAPGPKGPRQAATETLAKRAGALVDEIDFPAFVAGLVHSTFDAIVEASIRQMEAFADLVSTVARGVDDFTRDNITDNQARDSLRDKYPADLVLEVPKPGEDASPRLRVRTKPGEDEEASSPEWLKDYGLAGQPLTDELVEQSLVPATRKRLGEGRLQMLSTMVLLGMNRINVKDGSISAKVRFRAAARDNAAVDYAVNSDPGGGQGWGQKGSSTYAPPATMVSTVGVNVQSDTELKAELFGEVRINFVSETLPLDRFADAAQMQLLQGNARVANGAPAAAPAPPPAAPPAPAPPPAAAVVPAPAPEHAVPAGAR